MQPRDRSHPTPAPFVQCSHHLVNFLHLINLPFHTETILYILEIPVLCLTINFIPSNNVVKHGFNKVGLTTKRSFINSLINKLIMMPGNVGSSWTEMRQFQCETKSVNVPDSSAGHAGLLVVDQPEAPVALVFRGIVGCPLTPLVSIRDHPQHEGLGVADHGAQRSRAVHSLSDLNNINFRYKPGLNNNIIK